MDPCPFCDLAAGTADGELVALRTPGAVVVPVPEQRTRNHGHVLVVPVRHVTRMADMEPALLQEVYGVAGRVASAVRTAFGAAGATILQNDGAPDQALHHVHVHVIPRRPGDGFRIPEPDKEAVTREERRVQAEALRRALGG